ncbi:hypothetical protein SAMN05421810_106235 [Amycolatopsis arida]|uniref:V8-like Glu-specific endopeptidase n=1 Tax=Amycolatopsis arida TaxID=587909 RepID=A0A1I5XSX5_9PSEU|nr:peptidase [Amycolatopsis arida]TDX97284.1 hypothetical protein CLV69_102387 [Amycolatopsis arida]SFQ35020.1 hypothetical protein SAMN05421810_106235 [Amycolatopsis arida]
MERGVRRSAVITAVAAVLSVVCVVPVAARSVPDSDAVHAVSTPAEVVTEYWTPERMRAAEPMERRVAEDEAAPVDGFPPDLNSEAVVTGEEWTNNGLVAKTTGRVFFTFDGRDSSCSGSAVKSDNGSVVITAGHCVMYQGSWHKNWLFVPGYSDGNAPFGEWPARLTMVTPQWEANENLTYDIGAGVVEQVDGRKLTDAVGGQEIAFNQQRNQRMYSFGYPATGQYDGSALIYCSGPTFVDVVLTQDHGMRCGMTGGSSGGPWFLEFDEESGTGKVASVNSFYYWFLPGFLFGPYFGAEAQALYNRAQSA